MEGQQEPAPATVTRVQPGAVEAEGVGEGEGAAEGVGVALGVALALAPEVKEALGVGLSEGRLHCTRVTMLAPVFDTHSVPEAAAKSRNLGELSCPSAPMPGR